VLLLYWFSHLQFLSILQFVLIAAASLVLLLPADRYCHVTVLVYIGFFKKFCKIVTEDVNDQFARIYNVLTVVSCV